MYTHTYIDTDNHLKMFNCVSIDTFIELLNLSASGGQIKV